MARKLCVGYNEYYKMISMKNIIRAYKNARKGNTRHDSVARYDQMLMLNLGTAYRLLYCGKYEVSPYNEFKVYEPKPRIIKALPFKDRVIQHVLFDYIAPKLEKTFIYDSYANRDGKGTHRGVYREQQFLRKAGKGSYIIKADIHHFFDSIDKVTLLNILYKKIKDKKIMKLCEQFIMFDDKPNGIATKKPSVILNQYGAIYGIILDNSTVFLAISRIHDQKYQIKVYLVMALQFLKQLCHEHGILTAGNTDSDLIALLHQFILTDCLGKLAPDGLFKLFTQTLLDVKGRDLRLACLILRLHPLHEPAKITSL